MTVKEWLGRAKWVAAQTAGAAAAGAAAQVKLKPDSSGEEIASAAVVGAVWWLVPRLMASPVTKDWRLRALAERLLRR